MIVFSASQLRLETLSVVGLKKMVFCVPLNYEKAFFLLSLFPDEAKSVPMIQHSMNVIKKATEHLNPGQVPVIAVDQPLYSVAKKIQWNWPESHGEQHFVFILGGLHIEMAALSVLGDWLEDSGWTSALIQVNIASPGVVNSFLKGSNVKRTRRAHQVTAASLYSLLTQAYDQ